MKLLKEAIRKLNSREKNIMEMRFGFISGREKTQKEVADMLGISQSYISRLEKKIINKIIFPKPEKILIIFVDLNLSTNPPYK